MPTIDFSHLSPQERLDLIGEIWDSIEAGQVPLSRAQEVEIEHRLATLDEDIKHARDADAVLADFRNRYR
jgi:putative addiction module component (TIGR02574 family)